MSKSGVYAHFGSKQELQLATVDEAGRIFHTEVIEPALAAAPGLAQLVAVCDAFFDHLMRRTFPGGCFFAGAVLEMGTRPGPVKERIDVLIREKPVSALVVDPAAGGAMNVNGVLDLMKKYPSLPVVAYMALRPESFNAVARLSRHGVDNVLLHGFGDGPEGFRATVERASANPLPNEMLKALAPRLRRVPPRLSHAIQAMFEDPHRHIRVSDLASEAGMSSMRLYRHFEIAGLSSPKKLLVAAKVLRGCAYLADPGYSVRDVAKKLGYRNPRIFAQHCVDVMGLTPSCLRTQSDANSVAQRLLSWLDLGRIAGQTEGPDSV